MDKLNIEHLAAYLPYGVSLTNGNESVEMTVFNIHDCLISNDFKPLLHPLDLTTEIEHNGEKFVPLERLRELFGGRPISFDGMCFYTRVEESCVRRQQDVVPLHFSQYDAFQKLLEWHFDIFGLIEHGLAEEKK